MLGSRVIKKKKKTREMARGDASVRPFIETVGLSKSKEVSGRFIYGLSFSFFIFEDWSLEGRRRGLLSIGGLRCGSGSARYWVFSSGIHFFWKIFLSGLSLLQG